MKVMMVNDVCTFETNEETPHFSPALFFEI